MADKVCHSYFTLKLKTIPFSLLAHLTVSVLSFQPSVHVTEKQEFLCPGMLDFQS